MTEGRVILLVEDSPDDQELTLRALGRQNLANSVVVVNDGVEAIDYLFRSENSLPELILLDLNLPRISGVEVLARVRADPRTRLCPVVVLTSSTEERDLVDSYRLGANSYVQKPVDFIEFAEAVRQLKMYWLLLNRPPPREKLP